MTRKPRQRKSRLSSQQARKMGIASQQAQRTNRDADAPERMRELAEIAAINLPRTSGDILGCLQWTDYRTGRARRWLICIGDRRDRITIAAPGGTPTKSHGWTWFLAKLRKHITHA